MELSLRQTVAAETCWCKCMIWDKIYLIGIMNLFSIILANSFIFQGSGAGEAKVFFFFPLHAPLHYESNGPPLWMNSCISITIARL